MQGGDGGSIPQCTETGHFEVQNGKHFLVRGHSPLPTKPLPTHPPLAAFGRSARGLRPHPLHQRFLDSPLSISYTLKPCHTHMCNCAYPSFSPTQLACIAYGWTSWKSVSVIIFRIQHRKVMTCGYAASVVPIDWSKLSWWRRLTQFCHTQMHLQLVKSKNYFPRKSNFKKADNWLGADKW